jgi:uncharacterized membrane protein
MKEDINTKIKTKVEEAINNKLKQTCFTLLKILVMVAGVCIIYNIIYNIGFSDGINSYIKNMNCLIPQLIR